MQENADETSLVNYLSSMLFIYKHSMIEYIIYKISKRRSNKKMKKIILAYKNSLNVKKQRKTKQDSWNKLSSTKTQ